MYEIPKQPTFPDKYPQPDNQIQLETELSQDFNARYPEYADLLVENLGAVHSAAGLGGAASMPKLPTNNLRVGLPRQIEEGETINEAQGLTVSGELAPGSAAMLDTLFQLVGAETIRDDRAEGKDAGQVIRQGSFMGEPVYIVEGYGQYPDGSGRTGRSYAVLSEEYGRREQASPAI